MLCIVDAANGEGRMGLEGLFSELNVLNMERLSGNGGAFALLANVVPPPLGRCRRMASLVFPQNSANYLESDSRRLEAARSGGHMSLSTEVPEFARPLRRASASFRMTHKSQQSDVRDRQ